MAACGLCARAAPACAAITWCIGNWCTSAHMQVAINWCISKGCIPIPGAKTLDMAQDSISALQWSLSDAEIEVLDRESAGVKKGMVQNIFQTA
jgi:pyridoxine 4-dehydrogenase